MIPEKIIITAKGEFMAGLAVSLKFGMGRKNDYYYIVFLDGDGKAQVGKDELLRSFDQSRKIFGMDYCDAREFLTGQIEAHVLSKEEIEGAISGYNKFKRYAIYPPKYLDNLKTAPTINLGNSCVINVEQIQ